MSQGEGQPMDGDQLREKLAEAGVEYVKTRGKYRKAKGDLVKLLEEAKASPDVTMVEAAKLTGVGRVNAYKLIRKKSR